MLKSAIAMFKNSAKDAVIRTTVDVATKATVSTTHAVVNATGVAGENVDGVRQFLASPKAESFVKAVVGFAVPNISSFSHSKLAHSLASEARTQAAQSFQKDVLMGIGKALVPSLLKKAKDLKTHPTLRVKVSEIVDENGRPVNNQL